MIILQMLQCFSAAFASVNSSIWAEAWAQECSGALESLGYHRHALHRVTEEMNSRDCIELGECATTQNQGASMKYFVYVGVMVGVYGFD